MKTKIILTCEHADYKTPSFIKNKNLISKAILKSHRGWDQGAFEICKYLQKNLKTELHFFPYSRLFIDANRNLNKNALSSFSKSLSPIEIKQLTHQYSLYRSKILKSVQSSVKRKIPTLLFSIHSFTPLFKKKVRKTDLGLLFRPKIKKELSLAKSLRKEILKLSPELKVHFNQPYRGFTDCLSNDILDNYLKNKYINGLFLEINQKVLKTSKQQIQFSQIIENSILNLKY